MTGLAAPAPAPGPQRHTGIDAVAVVLPAHNEDQHIGCSLRAGRRAADELQQMRPEVVVRVMVVLDSCTDRCAQITAGYVDADPRFGTLDGPELLRSWLERHPFEEDHPHIYGANFGVRASAYLAGGAFSKQVSHEGRTLAPGPAQSGLHGPRHGQRAGADLRPDARPRVPGLRHVPAGTGTAAAPGGGQQLRPVR